MAVELENSIFVHVGRTGGYWVRDVLHEAGLFKGVVLDFHSMPHEIKDQGLAGKPMFAFLRNPVSWLASVWIHHINFGWGAADDDLKSNTFDGFIRNLFDKRPTYIRSIYEPILDHCDFVGKTENLRDDLAEAIRCYEGVDVTDVIQSTPTKNKSSDFLFNGPALATKENLEKLYNDNKDVFDRAGYEAYPAKYVANLIEEISTGEKGDALDLLAAEYANSYTSAEDTFLEGMSPEEVRLIKDKALYHDIFIPGTKEVFWSKFPVRNYFSKTVYHSIASLSGESWDKGFVIGGHDGGYLSYLKGISVGNVTSIDVSRTEGFKLVNRLIDDRESSFKFYEDFVASREGGKCRNITVVSDLFNRVEDQQRMIAQIASLSKPGSAVIMSCYCLDAYNHMPILGSLYGDYNPFNKGVCNVPNPAWLRSTMEYYGYKEARIVSHMRIRLILRSDSKYPELKIPRQYVGELDRDSAITMRTVIFQKR